MLESALEFIKNNVEWLFSGIGVVVLLGLLSWRKWLWEQCSKLVNLVHNIWGNVSKSEIEPSKVVQQSKLPVKTLDEAKLVVNILFIDDDTRFRVVKILQTAGWQNTKITKDLKSLDEEIIQEADIVFVDIQGVGRKLQFHEEGLGLASALIDKYPHKKIVIYSAETQGDRFHAALKKAASFLSKDAEPYEFQQLVEEFSLH